MLDERTGKALQTRDESGSTSSPTLCHPGVSRRRAIGSIAMLVAFIFLTACTDYVQQIKDRYGEWETSDEIVGSITDSRDGQTYKTVKIGSQIWMAENLNYKTENSWCGGGNGTAEGDCSKYGRLYTWAVAMDSVGAWSKNGKGCGYGTTCSPTYPVRGICPEGWHLPTEAEFETLFTAVGGKSTAGKVLKSTTGWTTYSGITNEDAFAFSALPAGGRYSGGSFSCEGDVAYFWSSTEYYGFDACLMYLDYCYGGAGLFDYNKYDGFSVRCLKD